MAIRTTINEVIEEFRTASSNSERGTRFEELMENYFRIDPTLASTYDEVSSWTRWQHNEHTHDSGIDLVARNRETGGWTAIQCKFYDPKHTLQKADIDSFFTASGRSWDGVVFDNRILISTTDRWSQHAENALQKQTVPVQRIGLTEIGESPIDWMLHSRTTLNFEARRAVRYGLRPHQKDAIAKIQEGFQTHDRGRWISACGTGKTFTSLKLAEQRCADNGGHLKVLFLAPSIALVSQTLREWLAQTQTDIHPFVVCSDTKASKNAEDISVHDIPLPTTDADKLASQMVISGRRGKRMTVVFSTYQSIDVVARAQQQSGEPFDLILCDEGTPTPADPAWLVTRILTTVIDGDGTEVYKLGATINGYAKVDAADVKSGWELRQPTTVTTDINGDQQAGAGDITRTTRYDALGRIIEDRQPLSSGADAGTRQTVYYTGTGSGACVSAAYAGLVCQVGPKAQPQGVTLPITKTTGYTWAMQPTVTVTTSGVVTQTTTTGYDTAFRPTSTQTVTTGLASSTPVPATTTTYDSAGRVATEANTFGTITHTYDQWGRETRYQTVTGGQTDYADTTYNTLGQVATVATNQATTTYTYDGVDALGQTERRGVVTKVTVTSAGKTWTSTGAYDPQGTLTLEKLPGGIIKRSTYDTAGELIDHTWNGPATQADGTVIADQPWLAWSSRSDPAGRVVHEWMPDGQLATTGDLGATVAASDRSYTYDPAGRLTQVRDLTGDPTITTTTPCTLRTYGFDRNGNRTSQGAATSTSNTCPTAVTSSTNRTYDAADRPTTGANGVGAYEYDPLGRQTSIPAVDTPQGTTAGNTALAYYDTDAIQQISQGATTIGFSLDPALRRATQTTTSAGVTSTLARHYTDSSDNPTWSVDTAGGQTTTTRYAELIAGDLGLTITTTSAGTVATLAVSGPRGDVTSQITLPADATTPTTGTPAGLDWWNDYTEHGQTTPTPTTTPGSTTGIGYGWLGTQQRATTTLGYTLMGARLHNPTTALFTTLDPQHQGGDTAYGYPTDPINHTDLDGRSWAIAGRIALFVVGQIARQESARIVIGTSPRRARLRGRIRPAVDYTFRKAPIVRKAWHVGSSAYNFVGRQLFNSRAVGSRSRYFGDKYTKGGPANGGILNRGKHFAIGWSGAATFRDDGSRTKRPRTTLRVKVAFGKVNLHSEVWWGPYR